ncbi:hypothetical protein FRC01_008441 [Tulasnella sp. 417]|nr:hypothetical protein FRC01_008441 [Tulasnella sp. 417]
MVHSLIKSLFLYSVLATSAALAAPAQTKHLPPGVIPRDHLELPHPSTDELTAPAAAAIKERSSEQGLGVKRVTNAMRIANGLPPLAPRKLYSGSRAGSAHKARSSPALPVGVPAVLIYGLGGRTGQPLGYLGKGLNYAFGSYTFTTDCKDAMANAQLSSGDLTIPAQSGSYPNVGIILPYTPVLDPVTNPGYYGAIGGTATTPNGSPPVTSRESSYSDFSIEGDPTFIESNVWSLGENNELIPTWINPNGDAVRMEIVYVPDRGNPLLITRSASALSDIYKKSYGSTSATFVPIRFFIEDQFTCP